MRHMVCSKNVCMSVLFDVLWPTMTILFVDPNLTDANRNGHDLSLEMAGPACSLSCDAVTAGEVYHVCILSFAIVCTLSCLQPLQ